MRTYYRLSRANLPSLINKAASASDNGILVPSNPSGGDDSLSPLSTTAGGVVNESPPLLTVNFGPASGLDKVFRAFLDFVIVLRGEDLCETESLTGDACLGFLAPGDLEGGVDLEGEGVKVPDEAGFGVSVDVGVGEFVTSGRTKNLGPFEGRCVDSGLEGIGVFAVWAFSISFSSSREPEFKPVVAAGLVIRAAGSSAGGVGLRGFAKLFGLESFPSFGDGKPSGVFPVETLKRGGTYVGPASNMLS
jgi:hypothetical protein